MLHTALTKQDSLPYQSLQICKLREAPDNYTSNTKTENKRGIYEHGADTKINYDAIITV